MKSDKNVTKRYKKNVHILYVAKNLITIAIYKSVLKSLRLSQRDIKVPLLS